MSSELTIVHARIQKAAIAGAMGLAEQVELFSDIDKLLKEHAKKKHSQLSHACRIV